MALGPHEVNAVTRICRYTLISAALAVAGCSATRAPLRDLPMGQRFAVVTQLPPRRDDELTNRFEQAYSQVAELFGHTGAPPWPGRCEVYCLRSREEFEHLVARLGHIQPHTESHAYQIATGSKVTILLDSSAWLGHGQIYPRFAHEVTHAFLTHCAGRAPLPLWVHEGLAQHFEFQQPEAKADAKRHQRLRAEGSADERREALRAVLSADAIDEADERAYAMTWRLAEELLGTGHDRFPQFVRKLNAGAEAEEALEQVYGWSSEELVRRCAAAP